MTVAEEKLACIEATKCPLRLGMVVRATDAQEGRRTKASERGIVVWLHGHGDPFARMKAMFLYENDAIIACAPGHYVVSNAHHEWEPVPSVEQTAAERVVTASLTWVEPTWRDPADGEYEPDSYVFALIRALLDPAEEDEVFHEDGDWPMSVYELVQTVARCLDERRPARHDDEPVIC